MRVVFLCGLLGLLAAPALAQQTYIKSAFGTGFYINREGHLITNDHVVRGCQQITVKGPQGDTPATLVANDAKNDLAVLKIDARPQSIAPLRWNIRELKVGDGLYLYGFPGENGVRGMSTFAKTTVLGMQGPTGEPHWLQLQHAANHGNSGGPVLDGSGNVIAVITGNLRMERQSDGVLVKEVDYAVTLAALQDFLRQHRIGFYQYTSGQAAKADAIIARDAAQFVFRVQCVQGMVQR